MERGDPILLVTLVFHVFVFLFGASIGSFLNVCIYRLPAGQSIVRPRSRCPTCRNTIRWHDNLPVLSWFLLRGRCRYCGAPISFRYPAVEGLVGALAVLNVHHFGPPVESLLLRGDTRGLAAAGIYFALACALVVIAGVDLDHQIIPDAISLPGIAAGLAASFVLPIPFRDSALGAVLGAGSLWVIAKGYSWIVGREGMGLGDVKLLAMIGAFVGWKGVLFTLLASSVTGAVVMAAVLPLRGRGLRQAFPFGPFLCLAALVYVFCGPPLVAWYLSLGRP